MLSLSLTQPWASLVIWEEKCIETRSWAPPRSALGKVIAIHSSKGFPAYARDFAGCEFVRALIERYTNAPLPLGAIIGIATLVDFEPTRKLVNPLGQPHDFPWAMALTPKELRLGNYEHEDPPGRPRYGWLLEDARELPEPIPCKGALGLWTVPPEIEARVRAQLG